jgi:hypothetical protein
MSEQLMNVSVAFYSLDTKMFWSKFIKIATLGDKYQHCGIILHRNGVSAEYVTALGEVCRFSDACAYRKIHTPSAVITLGSHFVNFNRLQLFADRFHSEDARSILWWWFVGRFLFPKMLPPTCTLITCQLLRLCGIPVGNITRPQKLFKELTNETNNYCWESKSWENYASQYHRSKDL